MALRFPDAGEVAALKAMVNHTSPGDLKLHLYKNDVTIDEDTVIGDVTESTEAGYAAVTLTGASWTVATGAGNVTTASYAEQTFTFTEAATVYGYYVTNNAGTILMWIEEFTGGPYVLPASGGSVAVTLNVIGQSPIS